jgi:molybdopterin converting factor small subunit
MELTVRYFAAAADAAGCEDEVITIADDATVSVLTTELERRYGDPMLTVLRSGSFLVNGVVQRDPGARLGLRVDVLPPFAGG